ncbi:hypothetical protein UA08_02874 [Talaromyces atroroseus]|uniref:Uncharacterized protein n=1 Tax=Talaromyces atroroseus TaxID=1441469 RepID=A0A225AQM3_TALAT|nr:hypothetical protein UA08_02874 [Talaromyces atroroseus]OKL61803.1 hypothetical protein UA08_02874 [Talaromyces atroroseus]
MFAWDSLLVVTLLILGGILFCVFLAWQWNLPLYRRNSTRESVFPRDFSKHHVLMIWLLTGVFMMMLVLELPSRFRIINGSTGLDAGVRVLPLTLKIAFGSGLTGGLTARHKLPRRTLRGPDLGWNGHRARSHYPTRRYPLGSRWNEESSVDRCSRCGHIITDIGRGIRCLYGYKLVVESYAPEQTTE